MHYKKGKKIQKTGYDMMTAEIFYFVLFLLINIFTEKGGFFNDDAFQSSFFLSFFFVGRLYLIITRTLIVA